MGEVLKAQRDGPSVVLRVPISRAKFIATGPLCGLARPGGAVSRNVRGTPRAGS